MPFRIPRIVKSSAAAMVVVLLFGGAWQGQAIYEFAICAARSGLPGPAVANAATTFPAAEAPAPAPGATAHGAMTGDMHAPTIFTLRSGVVEGRLVYIGTEGELNAVVAREVVAGRNRRNAKVVALVGALAFANLAFHFEDAASGFALYSQRGALALVVMLILLVGGRVAPSFTNNWLARAGLPQRPAPFGKPDIAVMALSALALAAWTWTPYGVVTVPLALAASLGNLYRLARWRGFAARRDALAFVLHAGFGLAAVGFLVAGAVALAPNALPYDAGVHVWAVGAAGLMTLAMMTRATLGHSGQPWSPPRRRRRLTRWSAQRWSYDWRCRCCRRTRQRSSTPRPAPGFSPSPHSFGGIGRC